MSIFLTDPLIDSLRPKPPEEPQVPDYGGQDYPTPQPMATPDYGGQDYPSFPQAQVQQAPQLGTYTPEAAPSTYDYTPQPQPSFYQPGGAVGDVFSGLGSAVNRGLSAYGQRQIDENQRAMAQGQAVGDFLSTTRWQDPQTYKDWANTALKYAAESNIRQLQGKPSEASYRDIALLAPPSLLRGNAVAEMAGNPLTYLGGWKPAAQAIAGAGLGELGKYGVEQAGGTEGQQQAAELIGNVLPFGKDIYGLGKGVVNIGKGAVNLADKSNQHEQQ